jgi:DNA-binding transcriptional MerR regulator
METSRLIGTGGLAKRLGISQSRVRQLEAEGVIPPAQRLVPGDRRVYAIEDVEAIKDRLQERRAARSREGLATTAA